jgi:transcriptional regulator with XRE-family HTH domain
MESNLTVSVFLKKVRYSNGSTIREAAKLIGTSYSRLSKIENNKENITLELMDRICNSYGIDVVLNFKKRKNGINANAKKA